MDHRRSDFTVLVNKSKISIGAQATLGEVLAKAGAVYDPGSIIALGHRSMGSQAPPSRFSLTTEKGIAIIEFERAVLNDPVLIARLSRASLEVVHADIHSVSIGAFNLDRIGNYKKYHLKEGFVYLDASGLDTHRGCLVFCKKRYSAFYCLTSPIPLGKVVSGWKIILDLMIGDKASQLAPLAHSDDSDNFSYRKTTDLETVIGDDDTVVHSLIEIRPFDSTPQVVEHLLQATENSAPRIAVATGSFISMKGTGGVQIREENPLERRRGSVTIRNNGKAKGDIYIFRTTRPKSRLHTVVGEITSGMMLADLAIPGDLVTIRSQIKRINTIGMTQDEAQNHLESVGIDQTRKGSVADDSIVVKQNPSTTIEIAKSGSVDTFGLPKSRLVRIHLHEGPAPNSVRYFRAVTGLLFSSIGSLRVEYAYSKLVGAVLLKGDPTTVELSDLGPENVPKGLVIEGTIGITNSVKARMGAMGIRIDASREFGPTCEALACTNIIGQIENQSMALVKSAKSGSELFFAEAQHGTSQLLEE